MPLPDIVTVREGWLKKLGGFIKNWKERYFVLDSTASRRLLKYYESLEDEKGLGEIPLTKESTVVEEPVSGWPCCM